MRFGFSEFLAVLFEDDFPGGDVEHAVMEAGVESGPLVGDEFAVVMDGIACEIGRLFGIEMIVEEFEEVTLDRFGRSALLY